MGIVTAGVHGAGDPGGVRDVVRFLDGEGVHIGTETDGGASSAQVADHAGPANSRLDGQAQVAEDVGRELSGAVLLEPELRVGVDIAAPGDESPLYCARSLKHP
jgi:hypothetical protein